MKLLKSVKNIGIYLSIEKKSLESELIKELDKQLMGFEGIIRKENYRVIFKELKKYDLANGKGTLVPENSINFDDGTFYNMSNVNNLGKFAFNLKGRELTIWIESIKGLSMPYFLQKLLAEDNKYFVHSAGVSYKNEGILLPAFGGIGKTIFIAKALKNKNCKLLGDDLVILSKKGFLEAYARPFCIYSYHKELFKEYFQKNKTNFKTKNLITRIIRKIQKKLGLNELVLDYKLVAPNDLYDKKKVLQPNEKVKLSKVCMLRRVRGIKEPFIEKTTKEDIASFIVNVMCHEWWMYLRLEYRLMAEKGISRANYLKNYENEIKESLNNVKNFEIINIPEKMIVSEVSDYLVETILK